MEIDLEELEKNTHAIQFDTNLIVEQLEILNKNFSSLIDLLKNS